MLRKEVVAILVAAFCGLIAALMILNFLKTAAQPKKEFVVAAQNFPVGHVLTKENLSYSSPRVIDESVKVEDYFLLIPDVIGTKTVSPLKKGNLIKRTDVDFNFKAEEEIKKDKKMNIPKGMRALSIQGKDIRSMPAVIEIGDYVDIIGMVTSQDTGESLLKTISAGTEVADIERDADRIRSLTVVINQRDAELIFRAITSSPLQIVITSGPEDKSAYGESLGRIEIIRGVTRSRR